METQGVRARDAATEGAPPAFRSDSAGARTMLVAVEATRLAREMRGIGRYVRALLPRLVAHRQRLRLILFVKGRDVDDVTRMVEDSPVMRGRVEVRPAREMARSG